MPTDYDLSGSKTLPPLPPPGGAASAGASPAARTADPSGQSRRGSSSKAADRWAELNDFVDVSLRNLGSTAAAVWLVLFRDARGGVARVSQKWIAERLGKDERTVRTALDELIAAGLVEKKRQGGVGAGSNVYLVRSKSP